MRAQGVEFEPVMMDVYAEVATTEERVSSGQSRAGRTVDMVLADARQPLSNQKSAARGYLSLQV